MIDLLILTLLFAVGFGWNIHQDKKEKVYMKLGDRQKVVLDLIKQHGEWGPASMWVWENPSVTNRICQSLERRGLVRNTSTNPDLPHYVPAD